jgi:hypothetical protein
MRGSRVVGEERWRGWLGVLERVGEERGSGV